jgi:competence protein ComEA
VPDRLRRLAAALDARPAELVGLVVLLVGGLVAATAAWLGPLTTGRAATSSLAPSEHGIVLTDVPGEPLTVHVAGGVRRPGVVRLDPGARVGDAIEAAGGARPDAVLDALNLAALLEDGQQVMVPTTRADDRAAPAVGGAPVDGRVDLNRATSDDLETLPGVGPVLAARILAWREEHGPFREASQLRQVPGIGERTFQSLADLVRV